MFLLNANDTNVFVLPLVSNEGFLVLRLKRSLYKYIGALHLNNNTVYRYKFRRLHYRFCYLHIKPRRG